MIKVKIEVPEEDSKIPACTYEWDVRGGSYTAFAIARYISAYIIPMYVAECRVVCNKNAEDV